MFLQKYFLMLHLLVDSAGAYPVPRTVTFGVQLNF